MAGSLFTSSWYRVKGLKPQLRGQAKIVRHVYRDEVWYVIQDTASGKMLRIDEVAHQALEQLDGRRNVEEIWLQLQENLGDRAPTQDELIGLFTQLHQTNLLLGGNTPDLSEIKERRKKNRLTKIKQYVGNPLALKLPLIDPDRFLTRLVGLFPRGSAKWVMAIWFIGICAGVMQAALNWEPLTLDITSRVFNAQNMLMLWFAFPLLKAIHELGHGIAIKGYGGSCREMGLMFLLFIPVPYVDASSSMMFKNKRHRIVVSLAGMMIEMFVASIAIWVWASASGGPVKALLHEVIILASITTLFFNGNPLLRFDAYYAFADWLEIPNLAQKSNKYIGHLLQKHVFKVGDEIQAMMTTKNETGWLVFYSIASFIYRMIVAFGIVFAVAQMYFFVGVLLALWAAWTMLIMPLHRVLKELFVGQSLRSVRKRAVTMSTAVFALFAMLITLVPAPSWSMAEGIIWMPENARVTNSINCFGHSVLVPHGSKVELGQPILRCDDPDLLTQLEKAKSRQDELLARVTFASANDPVQQGVVQAELDFINEEVRVLERKLGEMVIRSPNIGVFYMDAPGDFPGRYFERGSVLGDVVDPKALSLITVVPQSSVALVRENTQHIEIRTSDNPMELVQATMVREVPSATKQLPSLALALQGGGDIGLDPESDPGTGPKALDPLFQFEVRFQDNYMPNTLGNRVFVRFVHRDEPLAEQWYRTIRQLFLKRFAL